MDYFDYEHRVRYGDTDKMGVSYYANYLVWFEAARTEYFRAINLLYTECEASGFFLPVSEASIRYHAPSTYDDLVVIRTSVSQIKNSSMKFEYQAFDKESQKLLATGFTVHVFVNQQMRPTRMPDRIKNAVTTHSLLPESKKNLS